MNACLNDAGRYKRVWASIRMFVVCVLAVLLASASANEALDSAAREKEGVQVNPESMISKIVKPVNLPSQRAANERQAERDKRTADERLSAKGDLTDEGRSAHVEDMDHERVKRLTAMGNRMTSIAEIDSLPDLSPEDKAFLKHRYRVLHPLD